MNRRSFFKYALTAVTSFFLAPLFTGKGFLAFAQQKAPLKETDPMAQALGYKNNNAKVDTKKWTKKAGAAGKGQKCATCQFYTAIDGKHGNCQIFVNNTVMANGWCNSWSKKA